MYVCFHQLMYIINIYAICGTDIYIVYICVYTMIDLLIDQSSIDTRSNKSSIDIDRRKNAAHAAVWYISLDPSIFYTFSRSSYLSKEDAISRHPLFHIAYLRSTNLLQQSATERCKLPEKNLS